MRFKSIHLFALAIALAFTTAFATTSSSHSKLTRYYYYDNDGAGSNTQQWHSTAPDEDLELSCAPVPNKICSADFDIQPENYPVTNGAVASNITPGQLQ